MNIKKLSLVAATCLATSSVALADAGLDNTFGVFISYHTYNEQAMAISKLCKVANEIRGAITDEFYYGYHDARADATSLIDAAELNTLWTSGDTVVSDMNDQTTEINVAQPGAADTVTVTLEYRLMDGGGPDDSSYSKIVATISPAPTNTSENHNYSRIESLSVPTEYNEVNDAGVATALNLPDALANLLSNDCQIGRLSDN
jgi:hypothetical protein